MDKLAIELEQIEKKVRQLAIKIKQASEENQWLTKENQRLKEVADKKIEQIDSLTQAFQQKDHELKRLLAQLKQREEEALKEEKTEVNTVTREEIEAYIAKIDACISWLQKDE